MGEAAAKADWQRHQREALFLTAYFDRFGRAASYSDYLTAEKLSRVGLVTWIAHAQPASHSPFHSVTPSQPAAFQQACLLAGRLHCNSAVVAANGDGQLSHIGLPGGSNLAAQLPTMQPTGTNSGVTALFLGAGFVLIGTQDGTVQMGSFDGDMVQLTKHEAAVTDVHCVGSLVASSGMDGGVLHRHGRIGRTVARARRGCERSETICV